MQKDIYNEIDLSYVSVLAINTNSPYNNNSERSNSNWMPEVK